MSAHNRAEDKETTDNSGIIVIYPSKWLQHKRKKNNSRLLSHNSLVYEKSMNIEEPLSENSNKLGEHRQTKTAQKSD